MIKKSHKEKKDNKISLSVLAQNHQYLTETKNLPKTIPIVVKILHLHNRLFMSKKSKVKKGRHQGICTAKD